mmetsp:Transcript_16272/g.34362  ORF Transcript_16272/g.34362 Transcript_16272/m.34362 type:complete len:93 (-) Transcript_16272:923-1201(-)
MRIYLAAAAVALIIVRAATKLLEHIRVAAPGSTRGPLFLLDNGPREWRRVCFLLSKLSSSSSFTAAYTVAVAAARHLCDVKNKTSKFAPTRP